MIKNDQMFYKLINVGASWKGGKAKNRCTTVLAAYYSFFFFWYGVRNWWAVVIDSQYDVLTFVG